MYCTAHFTLLAPDPSGSNQDKMPDPAIEAHKAGLDYTEPTGKGVRKAKVSYEWVRDPNNPSAPPRQRRIIEAAPKKGMFEKLFGGGGGGNGGGGGQANAPVPIPVRRTRLLDDETCSDGDMYWY
jgi:hypothetical protein